MLACILFWNVELFWHDEVTRNSLLMPVSLQLNSYYDWFWQNMTSQLKRVQLFITEWLVNLLILSLTLTTSVISRNICGAVKNWGWGVWKLYSSDPFANCMVILFNFLDFCFTFCLLHSHFSFRLTFLGGGVTTLPLLIPLLTTNT